MAKMEYFKKDVYNMLVESNIPPHIAYLMAATGLLYTDTTTGSRHIEPKKLGDTVAMMCGYATYKGMYRDIIKKYKTPHMYGCDYVRTEYDVILPEPNIYTHLFKKYPFIEHYYGSHAYNLLTVWRPGMFEYFFGLVENMPASTFLKDIKEIFIWPYYEPFYYEYKLMANISRHFDKLQDITPTKRFIHITKVATTLEPSDPYYYYTHLKMRIAEAGLAFSYPTVMPAYHRHNVNPNTYGVMLFPVAYGHDKDKSIEKYNYMKNAAMHHIIGQQAPHRFIISCCNLLMLPFPNNNEFCYYRAYLIDYLSKLTPEDLIKKPQLTSYAFGTPVCDDYISRLANSVGPENLTIYELHYEKVHGNRNATVKKYTFNQPQVFETLSLREFCETMNRRILEYRDKMDEGCRFLILRPENDAYVLHNLALLECEFKLIYNMVTIASILSSFGEWVIL